MATYEVRKGDTFSEIAEDAGLSLSALIKLNPQIKNPSLIKPGQVITTSKATSPASTSTPAPAGGNDAQNAARLATEEAAKAAALSPAGVRAAIDKINAEETARQTRINTDPDVIAARKLQAEAAAAVEQNKIDIANAKAALAATKTANAAAGFTPPVSTQDNFADSVKEAAGMDSSSYAIDADGNRTDITNVPLTGLTSEEQAAISGLDTNQGLAVTSNLAVEGKGSYKQDITTGVLTLDGQPYNGSYNGFDYVDGIKYGATTKQVVKTGLAGQNTFSITGSDPTDTANADAFAVIRMILDSYGIGDELAEELIGYMTGGKGPEEAMLLIKQNPTGAYKRRFAGNELRIAAGLNVMSEKDYLELEDTYAETLRKYGLGNMLSTDRKVNQAMFAKYMANDLNAPEFKDRIALATERVMNADALTRGMFKEFYPTLTDADLVAYFLSPTDTLIKLKEKVTSAEIGGIALSQDLKTSMASATDLAKFGVDKAAAIEGYSLIKDVLPTSQKLGNVYQEAGIKYDQASGEAEFFKQNQDAKLKRKRLESLERGSFSASAGNAANAYKMNTAGQI
jgi:hypothetical protein